MPHNIECRTIWWRRLVMKVILQWGRCTLNCELYSLVDASISFSISDVCMRWVRGAFQLYMLLHRVSEWVLLGSIESMQHSMVVCIPYIFHCVSVYARIRVHSCCTHISSAYDMRWHVFMLLCISIIQHFSLCSFGITNLSRSFSFYYIHFHMHIAHTLTFGANTRRASVWERKREKVFVWMDGWCHG